MIGHFRLDQTQVELPLMRRLWFASMLASGCWTPPECTTVTLDTACLPQYVPTFDNVFENTLKNDCGSGKGSCHANNGDGEMSLADPETAYASLLAKVNPENPRCSELIVRTHEEDEGYSMPPGLFLAESERCALLQWVQAGAPGPGQPLPPTWSAR